MKRDQPQRPRGTRGLPANGSATKQLSLSALFVNVHYPARTLIAIERTCTIQIAFLPIQTKIMEGNGLHICEAMRVNE